MPQLPQVAYAGSAAVAVVEAHAADIGLRGGLRRHRYRHFQLMQAGMAFYRGGDLRGGMQRQRGGN